MFCSSCGRMIPDGTQVCPNCGAFTGNQAAGPNPQAAAGGQPVYNNQPRQGGNFTGYRPNKRELVMCIILSFVTCGIYAYYWQYVLTEDMGGISGRKEMSSGMVVLLSIVTCGIYMYIWMYQQGQKVDELKQRNGLMSSSTGLMYLLLSIFGLSIVSMALLQNEVNAVAEGRYNA